MSRLNDPLHVRPWSAGALHLAVAFGAVAAVLCLDVRTVEALDAAANTSEGAWCVETGDSGVRPTCAYHDFLICAVAAIQTGGSCKARSSIPADKIDAIPHRAPASSRRSTTVTHRVRDASRVSTLSIAAREKLFREFAEWHRRRSNE